MKAVEIPLTLKGVTLTGTGKKWTVAGDDPMVYNEPGKEPAVSIVPSSVNQIGKTLTVPACSVTLYALEVE